MPDITITTPIHLELVRVLAGEFLMGSDPAKDKEARDAEQPQHRVYVSEFYISKYLVTNEQYAAFVKATRRKVPKHWENGQIPLSKEKHPVVNVSWYDTAVFCSWLTEESGQNFRVPTEAEWEKAARGADGRIYPWGNEWDETKANSKEGGPADTTRVGHYSPQGDSPYRTVDMSGNVWEWCWDSYDSGEYKRRATSSVRDPQGPQRGAARALRGGSWTYHHRYARCAVRFVYRPVFLFDDIGYRVVVFNGSRI